MPNRNYTGAERAPFRNKFEGVNPDLLAGSDAVSNNFTRRATTTSADQSVTDIYQVDPNGNLLIGAAKYTGLRHQENFYLGPAGLQTYPQAFWISDGYYYITAASLSYHAANGATMTAQIVLDRGVGAPGSGSNQGGTIMSNTFNMNTTIDTPQNATLAANYSKTTIAAAQQPYNPQYSAIAIIPGDRLSLVLSTTTTSLAGVVVSVTFAPGGISNHYNFFQAATAQIVTQPFAIVTRPGLTVTGVSVYYQHAGTDAGAVTVNVTQDANGTAAGSGTALLASAVSVKQLAGTVYNATLSATAANLLLLPTNRLSIVVTGTTTALTGLVVMVYTTPTQSLEASFQMTSNTNLGTATAFAGPFDRDYEVVDVMASPETNAGGSYTIGVTNDAPGVAPGAGLATITPISLNGTASTVLDATLGTRANRILPAGNRLSVVFSGTKGTTAGVVLSAVLLPR